MDAGGGEGLKQLAATLTQQGGQAKRLMGHFLCLNTPLNRMGEWGERGTSPDACHSARSQPVCLEWNVNLACGNTGCSFLSETVEVTCRK